MAILLDGKSFALELSKEIQEEVRKLKGKNVFPCLAVCMVGDDQASQVYVGHKQRACEKAGIRSVLKHLPSYVRTEEIIRIIEEWNVDEGIHGILVQLPLPGHVNKFQVINAVSPLKDVDGFNSVNLGRLLQGAIPHFYPCTPQAVCFLLEQTGVSLQGKSLCIINDTLVVGRPLAMMALAKKATVTICHDKTVNLQEITSNSDVVITAVGKRPAFHLTSNYIKKDAVVIDVGISRMDGRIVGDCESTVAEKAAWLTPVPNGVGPLTVHFLLVNTIKSCEGR